MYIYKLKKLLHINYNYSWHKLKCEFVNEPIKVSPKKCTCRSEEE